MPTFVLTIKQTNSGISRFFGAFCIVVEEVIISENKD